MLLKTRQRSPVKFGIKYFLIAELALLTGSYTLYAACNRSQQTRKFFHDTPYLRFIVESYYRIGEAYGTESVRAYDQLTWESQKKISAKTKLD